jgi:hypothetical protein
VRVGVILTTMTLTRTTLLLAGLATFTAIARAHPIPDVPVRASFDGTGNMTLRIEIDPRCFETDPNKAPSVLNKDLATLPPAKLDEWKAKAAAYAERAVEVQLQPLGAMHPEYRFDLTGQENAPLKQPDDIVVLTGTWQTKPPAAAHSYGIKAKPEGTLSVLYFNEAKGQKLERFQVLFPGESSYQLDLQTFAPIQKAAPTIVAEESSDAPSVSEFGISKGRFVIGSLAILLVGILLIRTLRR